MKSHCDGKRVCHVVVDDVYFENRCPDVHKYLEVVYECVPDQVQSGNGNSTEPAGSPSQLATLVPGKTHPPLNVNVSQTDSPPETLVDDSIAPPPQSSSPHELDDSQTDSPVQGSVSGEASSPAPSETSPPEEDKSNKKSGEEDEDPPNKGGAVRLGSNWVFSTYVFPIALVVAAVISP